MPAAITGNRCHGMHAPSELKHSFPDSDVRLAPWFALAISARWHCSCDHAWARHSNPQPNYVDTPCLIAGLGGQVWARPPLLMPSCLSACPPLLCCCCCCCIPADNVYGVLPINDAVRVSVALMVVHQFVAFALYCTPLLYMWEKFIHTHTKPWYIRLPSRLPIGERCQEAVPAGAWLHCVCICNAAATAGRWLCGNPPADCTILSGMRRSLAAAASFHHTLRRGVLACWSWVHTHLLDPAMSPKS